MMTPDTIRTVRKRQALTQQQFAEALDVDHTTVSRWERGLVSPEMETQRKLRDMLAAEHDPDIRAIEAQLGIVALFTNTEDPVILAGSAKFAALKGVSQAELRNLRIRDVATENEMESLHADYTAMQAVGIANLSFLTTLFGDFQTAGEPVKISCTSVPLTRCPILPVFRSDFVVNQGVGRFNHKASALDEATD